MSKKWYENITPKGVLINIKDDDFEETIVFKPHHTERFDTDELDLCVPVTAEEWWNFAPWQPIKTAPRDGDVFIVKTKKGRIGECVDCGNGFEGVFFDDENELIQWLPLPS